MGVLTIQQIAAALPANSKRTIAIDQDLIDVYQRALELRGYALSVVCKNLRRFSDGKRRHIELVLA